MRTTVIVFSRTEFNPLHFLLHCEADAQKEEQESDGKKFRGFHMMKSKGEIINYRFSEGREKLIDNRIE